MSWPWVVAFVALWILVLVLAVLMLGAMRRVVPLLVQLEKTAARQGLPSDVGGLPPGSEVPSFELINGAGEKVRFGETLPLPAVFLLVESGCSPCEELMEELDQQHADSLSGVPLYVVLTDESDGRGKFATLREKGLQVFEQKQKQVSDVFQQQAFPHAFAVSVDGRVADSTIANSVDQLKRLAEEARAYGEGKEAAKDQVAEEQRA